MNTYKIYNPGFITCMFWFIRLIYNHCLYASARLGGVILRTSVSSSKYTYVKKLNRLFFLIILKGPYTEPLSKATVGFVMSVRQQ